MGKAAGFILSKKLKRRIQELCGLQDLGREERLIRANEILSSKDLKQAICHQILGATFKDIERAMTAVINERQLTEEQEDKLELEAIAPEKFNPEITFKVNKQASNNKKEVRYTTYSREEVAALLAASHVPVKPILKIEPKVTYIPLPRSEAERLVREHFEYKQEEEKIQQERKKWDSQKTIEFVPKTNTKTKPSKSTKG